MSTQIKLEPGWWIRSGAASTKPNHRWHSVFHYCDTRSSGDLGHICYTPGQFIKGLSKGIEHEKPKCSMCHKRVPQTVLGFLMLCRWRTDEEER
jgi:hypothetical protein